MALNYGSWKSAGCWLASRADSDIKPSRVCRVLGVLRYLRENNPGAEIVALAVLPRGWTDAWHVYDWPSMYKRGIDVVNAALKDFAAKDSAVHYLDCGPALLPKGKVHSPFLLPNQQRWHCHIK